MTFLVPWIRLPAAPVIVCLHRWRAVLLDKDSNVKVDLAADAGKILLRKMVSNCEKFVCIYLILYVETYALRIGALERYCAIYKKKYAESARLCNIPRVSIVYGSVSVCPLTPCIQMY